MKKKIICISMVAVLSILATGCRSNEEGKKIEKLVLAEDVTKENERSIEVSVETIDLELPDGGVFDPSFYLDGKLYGGIHIGYGVSFIREPSHEYPIHGYLKEGLYTLNEENHLVESGKKVFRKSNGIIGLGYEGVNPYEEKIYSVDYRIEDEPRVDEVLTEKISEITGGHAINKPTIFYKVEGADNYYFFQWINEMGDKSTNHCIYDKESGQIYSLKADEESRIKFFYIKSLDSMMAWDINDDIIYETKLNNENIELGKYIEMGSFNDEKAMLVEVIGESEIAINYYKSGDNGDSLSQTEKIAKYDFNTNEFKVIYEAPKDKEIIAWYMGSGIFGSDEFEIVEDRRVYKNRYIMRLEDENMRVLYKENIEEENNIENQQHHWIGGAVNEEGSEIFLSIHGIDKDGNTVGLINKKYIINEN